MALENFEMTPVLVAGISAVAGLVSGAIASLIAPWAHWGIEKRRHRLLQRRSIIDDARRHLSGSPKRREALRTSTEFAAIRSHLSKDLVSNIEARDTSGGEQTIQDSIMRELSELEKKWKLI